MGSNSHYAKRTIKITELKDLVNRMILHSTDENISGREVLGVLISKVLMDSNNYCGFRYLSSDDMFKSDNGNTVGINHKVVEEEKFLGTDKTRVRYY